MTHSTLATAKKRRRAPIEYVEVLDHREQPVLVIPRHTAQAQQLPLRSVLVLVYNSEYKLYLQQRSYRKSSFPACWDLSATGHVLPGESRFDAAIREVNEEIGLQVTQLREIARVPASSQTNHEFVTLYSAGRTQQQPQPNPAEVQNGAYLDQDEIDCLCTHFPDQVTPALSHFWRQGLLFSQTP